MIGTRIRQLRLSKGMTLNELAEKTQTTAGYISQLERDLLDPSLSTLRKIASILDTPIFSLLDNRNNQSSIVYADKRQKMTFPDSPVIHELLTPSNINMNNQLDFLMLQTELAPKSWSNDERVSHNAEEWIYVMKGTLEILVNDKTYFLNEGDSLYILENTPHNIYNPGPKKAISISSMSPANFSSNIHP